MWRPAPPSRHRLASVARHGRRAASQDAEAQPPETRRIYLVRPTSATRPGTRTLSTPVPWTPTWGARRESRQGWAAYENQTPRHDRLGEPLDEVERRLGDLAPAVVDREGVASVRDLDDLRHGGVASLALVGGVRDRPRHRVVLLAVDDQQRTAVGVLGVHLRLRQRVEVRVAHLH